MDKPTSFQTYEDRSDPSTVAARLGALRTELTARGLDGFVVPHSDMHQNEYLPANAERLAWLTSFTGSAGAAVVLAGKAAIFVDGRYTLQVRAQTDTSLFEPRDLVAEGPQGWVPDHLPKGGKLGFDPWLTTANGAASLRHAAERAGGTLVACESNPLDAVWMDRPAAPSGKAVPPSAWIALSPSGQSRNIAYSVSPFLVKRRSAPVNGFCLSSPKAPAGGGFVGPSPY